MRPSAEEHVLGAAQADASRTEGVRDRGLVRLIGVGSDLHPAELVGPQEDLHEAPVDVGFLRREVTRHHLQDLARLRFHLRELDLAREAVKGDEITLSNRPTVHEELLGALVDLQIADTDNRRLAHLAPDDGGV